LSAPEGPGTWRWNEELQRYTSSDEYIEAQIRKNFDRTAERLFRQYGLDKVMETRTRKDPRTGRVITYQAPRWTLRRFKSLLREFLDRARFAREMGRPVADLSYYVSPELLDEIDWKGTRAEILEDFERITGLGPVDIPSQRAMLEEDLRSQIEYIESELKKYPKRLRTLVSKAELEAAEREIARLRRELEEAKGWQKEYEKKYKKVREEKREIERRLEEEIKKPKLPPVSYVWVRFLRDVPSPIMGADFRSYGPFRAGDVQKLPRDDAEVLIKKGVATADLEAKVKREMPPLPPEGVTDEWIEAVKRVDPRVKPEVIVNDDYTYSILLNKDVKDLGPIPMRVIRLKTPPEVRAFLQKRTHEGWIWRPQDVKIPEKFTRYEEIWHKQYSRMDLEPLTRDELNKIARIKHLPTKGYKTDVIRRILGEREIEIPPPPKPTPRPAPTPRPPADERIKNLWRQFKEATYHKDYRKASKLLDEIAKLRKP